MAQTSMSANDPKPTSSFLRRLLENSIPLLTRFSDHAPLVVEWDFSASGCRRMRDERLLLSRGWHAVGKNSKYQARGRQKTLDPSARSNT